MATVWLAYILSEGSRQPSVQGWADDHRQTLELLLGQPLCPTVEFSDDRLGQVLRLLSRKAAWEAVESKLWQSIQAVYGTIEVTGVCLDHITIDLPPMKLMAAAAEPSGHLLACDLYLDPDADNPSYRPLIARLRQLLDGWGCCTQEAARCPPRSATTLQPMGTTI